MLLVFRSVYNRVGLLLDRFGFFFSNLNFYLGGMYLLKQPSEAVLLCCFLFFFALFFFFTLQYCIGFAVHQHESATGVHMFPILNPPLESTRGGIQWNDFPFQFYILKCVLVYVLISRTFRHFILHCFFGSKL